MRTCKTLFCPGIPHLLESRISLHTAEKAENFLRFMLSDLLRGLYLRSLRSMGVGFTISHTVPYRILAPWMTQVPHLASHLEDLELGVLEELCDADLNLFDVIATLPSLRRLGLPNGNPKTMDLLSAIRSPLQELDVTFFLFTLIPDPLPHLGNINPMLTTLSQLRLNLCDRSVKGCNPVLFLTIYA